MKSIILIILLSLSALFANDRSLNLQWKGQASVIHASSFAGSFDESPTTMRYIPQLRLDFQISPANRLGFDAAVDVYNYSLGDSLVDMDGDLYRFTLRYDTPKTQVRVGLQKINFGPARMLRVLQWFDELDPRDPLALSPGVWAAMGRYYFDNGANLRLWTMADAPDQSRSYWGDSDSWPWDAGGRLEYPIPAGTLGLTLHSLDISNVSDIKENRIAGDVRVDAVVGLWSEVMFARIEDPTLTMDVFSVMAGVDYTFGLGNGLYTALEMATTYQGTSGDEMPWQIRSYAISANYTLGLSDGLTFYLYTLDFPILESQTIPMLGWQHTSGNWLFYLALYDMPEFTAGSGVSLPTGAGLQINIAFNH
ncbi:MAG: hypothetical protein HN995_11955 [Candidatus Marinimicrobia bacterium]|nr:hypothetical protein [Candidatus Neomarinimicrobiota bacterium]MBT3576379.1 hypothetical protein [Candidatus Neomarinimicrobiota bacterium]MBT3950062.1 hypothetical protein [Candidatus Neomarinimicrobiota bacterium]MBT4254361.1 hypothetical protein [Candidatus Neomarinimicrobiota bacterium]MBT4479862.1 hypothetical protein [Candidatus Neomarinimicrobiota bacterium]